MMGGLEALQAALAHGAWLAFPFAFFGGVLVGLNPCCLALYPAVTATCCGQASCEDQPKPALRSALGFVLGMASATSALGLLAALLGRSLFVLPTWFRVGVAFVPLVMGAYVLGWIRVPLPGRDKVPLGKGFLGAFLTGLLLSLVVGSCATPVLLALLTYAAVQGHLLEGALLMFIFGLGSGLPLLLAGTLVVGFAQKWLRGSRHQVLNQVAGISLLVLGYYLIWTLT
ncbi:MAG TPA: cytochrome c biogenesis protein CcdA [Geothrix sp.]|nr:cytochrome c biogenesis protein CcdA [Geothrix sp.]